MGYPGWNYHQGGGEEFSWIRLRGSKLLFREKGGQRVLFRSKKRGNDYFSPITDEAIIIFQRIY